MTPNPARVKEVAAAYGEVSIPVEYLEVPHSKARLEAAKKALYDLLDSQGLSSSGPIYFPTLPDTGHPGLIHATLYQTAPDYQLPPAVREFLDDGEYRDCFLVNVVNIDGDFIVNPDT